MIQRCKAYRDRKGWIEERLTRCRSWLVPGTFLVFRVRSGERPFARTALPRDPAWLGSVPCLPPFQALALMDGGLPVLTPNVVFVLRRS